MTTKPKPKKKPAKREYRDRSAVHGEFVTEAEAKAKPREHVRERVKKKSPTRALWRGWAIFGNHSEPPYLSNHRIADTMLEAGETVRRVRLVPEE